MYKTKLVGGINKAQLEHNAEAVKLIEETYLAEIKSKGCQCQSLKVNAMWSQVVSGSIWWFHVTTDKGEKWSITVYNLVNQPTEIKSVQKGHIDMSAYDD